jgi:glycosyltransferase involved in cell wall biosynthesis
LIVAVDSFLLNAPLARTGSHIYARNLLKSCLKASKNSTDRFEFHAFTGKAEDWVADGFASSNFRVHRSRLLDYKQVWRFGGMGLSAAALRPDLIFMPIAQGAMPFPSAPIVASVLDALYMRLPPEYLGKYRMRSHLLTWAVTKLATRFITISNCSKRDVVEIYGLDPERVEVTYPGFDSHLYNMVSPDPTVSADLLNRLGVRKPFVLHHGLVQLRKNVHRLIQAFDRVHSGCREFDAQLVLAGGMGYGYEEVMRVREASRNRNQIVITGDLPDAELAILVKNASLCVIPSLYEGFCLPMVEAMACGIPTVASNSSCIPEVSGGVLEYFDPLSVEEMSETIRRTLEDSALRVRLREKGVLRADEFTWERCANETLSVFAKTAA